MVIGLFVFWYESVVSLKIAFQIAYLVWKSLKLLNLSSYLLLGIKLLINVKNCESEELISTFICISIQVLCLVSPPTPTYNNLYILSGGGNGVLYSMKFKNIQFLFIWGYDTSEKMHNFIHTAILSRCYNIITPQNMLIQSFICAIISQQHWETKQFKGETGKNSIR